MIDKDGITYDACEIEKLYNDCKAGRMFGQIVYSMRDFLAKKNANSVFGSGFTFECEDENLVNEFHSFVRDNRFEPLVKFIERELSMHGRTIVLINKNKDGEIRLNVANPFFYAAIGKVFVTEELAVVWQRVVLDTSTYYVKSIYDREKMVNEIYDDRNQLQVFDQIRELKGLGIVPVWYHNLGFVPVVELTNYPIFEFQNIMFSPEMYYKVADWYAASIFEKSFYTLWKNLNKEASFCHSRIAMEQANQDIMDKIENAAKLEGMYDDSDPLGDYIVETGVGSKATAIPGVGDFTKYTAAMNDLMDFYFKFACSSRFSEGGGAQKTSAEANSSLNSQVQTLEAKIKHREFEYNLLLSKVFAAMGLIEYSPKGEYDFVFRINGNVQREESVYLDYILKQVQGKTMTLPEAIASLRGVSIQKAEKIFENIKQFNEENQELLNGPQQEGGGFASDGFTEGGRPEKKGKDND